MQNEPSILIPSNDCVRQDFLLVDFFFKKGGGLILISKIKTVVVDLKNKYFTIVFFLIISKI